MQGILRLCDFQALVYLLGHTNFFIPNLPKRQLACNLQATVFFTVQGLYSLILHSLRCIIIYYILRRERQA